MIGLSSSLVDAPVAAFLRDADTLALIGRAVPGGPGAAVLREGGVDAALEALRQGSAPQVLIVDLKDGDEGLQEVEPLFAACPAGTTVIALGTVNDVGTYRRLVAAGAADYLVKPLSVSDVRRAILTAGSNDTVGQGTPARSLIVLGARGGVGSSAVAASIAWVLAVEARKRTALVDLDLHFGTAALGFDVEPSAGLSNALRYPERIDSLFVSSAAVACGSHLSVLAGEEPPDEPVEVKPDALSRLIGELSGGFEFVVLDLPRHLLGSARGVVDAAHAVALVTDLTLAGLRDAVRLHESLARVAPTLTPRVVAGRAGLEKAGELTRQEFERGLAHKIDFVVPEDVKASRAAQAGRPLVAGRSRCGDALCALARDLAGIDSTAKTSRRKVFGIQI
jgi:pilus assembly protein CpaE